MPSAVALRIRGVALAAFAAVPLAFFVACTVAQGTTPSCVPNVDANGIKTGVENGCSGFAICDVNPNSPAECCKKADGTAFTGSELALCLYAYGAGPAPTSSATTGGSTSTGAGGAGGGP
jgi:hypothetical protein